MNHSERKPTPHFGFFTRSCGNTNLWDFLTCSHLVQELHLSVSADKNKQKGLIGSTWSSFFPFIANTSHPVAYKPIWKLDTTVPNYSLYFQPVSLVQYLKLLITPTCKIDRRRLTATPYRLIPTRVQYFSTWFVSAAAALLFPPVHHPSSICVFQGDLYSLLSTVSVKY